MLLLLGISPDVDQQLNKLVALLFQPSDKYRVLAQLVRCPAPKVEIGLYALYKS